MDEYDNDIDSNLTDDDRPPQNVKAEFDRKFKNLSEQNSALNEKLDLLMNNVINAQKPSPPSTVREEEDIDPDLEPGKFVQREISSLRQELNQDKANQAKQAALQNLLAEFPELQNPDSALSKASVQAASRLDDSIRNSPHGYRMAVLEAVAQVGRERRASSNNSESVEDFIASGSRGEPGSSGGPKKKGEGEVDEKTRVIAELMGLDTSDKEQMARLKARSERKSWNRYSANTVKSKKKKGGSK